jgi:hypothetical protein
MMLPRFTAEDAHRAWEAWGCNCGPTALAVVTGMTLDEVRPHLDGFDARRYTNPTMMFGALKSIGVQHWRIGAQWPAFGLARIQWEGPWTRPGVPMRARYRYTHWVGSYLGMRGCGVYDCNAMANGTGWVSKLDWEREIVPWILSEMYPRASGKWHVTDGIEVARPNAEVKTPWRCPCRHSWPVS